jgi:hypothetical protein
LPSFILTSNIVLKKPSFVAFSGKMCKKCESVTHIWSQEVMKIYHFQLIPKVLLFPLLLWASLSQNAPPSRL